MPTRPMQIVRVANFLGLRDGLPAEGGEGQASTLTNFYRRRNKLVRRRGQVFVAEATLAAAGDAAAQFDGASVLSVDGGGVFHPPFNTDLYVCFWFCVDAFPGAGVAELINVTGNAIATDGWFVFISAPPNPRLSIGSSDGAAYATLTFSAEDLVADKWYMAYCHWDNTGGTASYNITLYDTDGIINVIGTAGRFINDASPQPLKIGGGVAPQTWFEGRIDKLGIWTPTPPEAAPDPTTLFNAGLGLTGAEVQADADLLDNLVAWYDLDEATGTVTWPELLETHDATATGTVVSVPKAGSF